MYARVQARECLGGIEWASEKPIRKIMGIVKGKGQNTLWIRGAEPSGWNGMFLIDHHTMEAECVY